jgi:hypothetical protein
VWGQRLPSEEAVWKGPEACVYEVLHCGRVKLANFGSKFVKYQDRCKIVWLKFVARRVVFSGSSRRREIMMTRIAYDRIPNMTPPYIVQKVLPNNTPTNFVIRL